jgi:hypothetical protein
MDMSLLRLRKPAFIVRSGPEPTDDQVNIKMVLLIRFLFKVDAIWDILLSTHCDFDRATMVTVFALPCCIVPCSSAIAFSRI